MTSEVDTSKYIRYDAPGVQNVQPGEAEDIKAAGELINTMQRAHFEKSRHMYSGE